MIACDTFNRLGGIALDSLVSVFLPLSLALIMFALGVGLTLDDFRRVIERGKVFLVGALCQLMLIPVIAYGVILAFDISGEMAAGIMLLSFCPGGVTTNAVSKFADGDVALSVSLTAVVSLLSIVTVPFLVAWSVGHFMGAQAPEISVTSLAIAMVLITTLPVSLGMLVRGLRPALADRIEPKLFVLTGVLFVVIILAAIAANWGLFIMNFALLGGALITLNVVAMAAGLMIATVLGFVWKERKTISIEVGIQNGTLGITLAPLIMLGAGGLPTLALPSAVYSVVMYLTALPFVFWLRSRRDAG